MLLLLRLLLLLLLMMMIIIYVVTVLMCRYEYAEGVLTVHAEYTVDCAHSLCATRCLSSSCFSSSTSAFSSSSFLLSIPLPPSPSLSFSLCLLSFLHFFTSSSRSRLVPSCALVYSSISSFLLASSSRRPPRDWPMYGARNSDPHLRGSQFLRDPTFFPLFAFSSFASCFAGQSCLPLFGICPIPPPIPLLPPLSQFRVHRFFSLFNGMEHKLALRTPSSSFSSSSASSSSSSSSSTLSFQALPPSYIFHVISLSLLDGLKRLFLTRRKKAGLGSLDRIVATRTLGSNSKFCFRKD